MRGKLADSCIGHCRLNLPTSFSRCVRSSSGDGSLEDHSLTVTSGSVLRTVHGFVSTATVAVLVEAEEAPA